MWSIWLPGMLCQLIPEGASGGSGLLTRGRVVTSICRPRELEILHRWCSTCISACGYAGTACQLLPEGTQRCLREFPNLETCKVFFHIEIIYRLWNDIPKLSKACLWSIWPPGTLCQLLPEGTSGDSGLLRRGKVVTSICRPRELEILYRWCSTCISACGYAGTARQLLLEGTRGKLLYLALRRLIFLQNWLEIIKKA